MITSHSACWKRNQIVTMQTEIRLLGRYRLDAEIGRGGMGLVYRAYDELEGKVVAIKSLLVDGVPPNEREETLARFQREARASMILRHPHIVQVHDFIVEDGQYYLVMEYLEGQTLKAFQQGELRLSGGQLLDILVQICDGLHFAHQQGVIHRDIKPDNLFITSDHKAKIMDFGIARQNTSEHFLLTTQPGTMLGTLSYMSPEQLQDSAMVDPRTDIFSLGVVMYELFTGKLPFEGESMGQTVIRILTTTPKPPSELNSRVPPELEEIINKAMIKRRGQRYQTTQDLAHDLLKLRGKQAESAALSEGHHNTGNRDWARKTFRANAKEPTNEQSTRPMGALQEQLEKEGLTLEGHQAQTLIDRDRGLTLECTADGLQAWLTLDPTYAADMPTLEHIKELLDKAHVSYGLKVDVIESAAKQGYLERTLIASGEAPTPGQNAELEYLIQRTTTGPTERDDGRVDFRELHLHSSVQAGTPLLRKYPAIPGEAGISVYGTSIPPNNVIDCKLLEGPGTALASDDPMLLIATRAGMPVRMAATCRVESVLELENVGVATGNVRFDGTVVVRGLVQKGFRIEAGGDIIVHGNVEDAVLNAGGNLFLYAPVYGGAQTVLTSKYQLHGQFIQQAKIECGGDLFIREALMHCHTRVVGKAVIGGLDGSETGRGLVNGGELYGTHFVQLRTLGSASTTATQIALGSHPQLDAHLTDLEAQMAVIKQKLQDNIKNMIYLRTQGGAQSERMQALEAERSRLMFESNTAIDEIQFLKDSLKQAENPKSCRIRVTDTIQPGVKVNISGAARLFDNPEPGPLSLWTMATDARRREVTISFG